MKYIFAGIVAVLMTVASESTANTPKNEALNTQKVKLLKKYGVETVYTDEGKLSFMSPEPTTVGALLEKVQKVGIHKIDSIAMTIPNGKVEECKQAFLKAGIDPILYRGEHTTRLIGTIGNVPLNSLPGMLLKQPGAFIMFVM